MATDQEIIQGSLANPKRPEADRVSAIVEVLSPPAFKDESPYEKGKCEGKRQALEAQGSDSYAMIGSGPDDPKYKEWQKGYEEGRDTINLLFGKK